MKTEIAINTRKDVKIYTCETLKNFIKRKILGIVTDCTSKCLVIVWSMNTLCFFVRFSGCQKPILSKNFQRERLWELQLTVLITAQLLVNEHFMFPCKQMVNLIIMITIY